MKAPATLPWRGFPGQPGSVEVDLAGDADDRPDGPVAEGERRVSAGDLHADLVGAWRVAGNRRVTAAGPRVAERDRVAAEVEAGDRGGVGSVAWDAFLVQVGAVVVGLDVGRALADAERIAADLADHGGRGDRGCADEALEGGAAGEAG